MKKFLIFGVSAFFLNAAPASTERAKEWRFDVYLDDRKVGYHNFRLEETGDRYSVVSDAHLNVKFLFFNAYRYRHTNREVWRDGCLQSLESRTDDNGEPFQVNAQRRGEKLIVESSTRAQLLSGCVKSFAYWDPTSLEADKLLNAQTGEHLNVTLQDMGDDRLAVRGNSVPARRFRLTARDRTIDLWYSPQRQWLALESRTNGGRLRYQIR